MQHTMQQAVQQNDALAFRLALSDADPAKDEHLAIELIEKNRNELFNIFVSKRVVSSTVLTHIVRLDRAAMLFKTRMPADDAFRMALIWECFQYNAPKCFEVALRGTPIDDNALFMMNGWLYAHAAHRLVNTMTARRFIRPEYIREGLLRLRAPAWQFLEALLPYLAHFDSPDLLVEMIERKNYWFIKFYALHIRSVCRNQHTLFDYFRNSPDICMHLRAFCTCQQPWKPNDMRIELVANWQAIQDFHWK